MKLVVIGTGYVGLISGLCFAEFGFDTVCVDKDQSRLNIIRKGHNYGWPIITYGINYNGIKISDKTHMDGMEQPVWHWTPSIAVCGMKFYYGESFGPWNGNILVYMHFFFPS